MTLFIFPRDIFNPRSVDEEFSADAKMARQAGHQIALLDHEALREGKVNTSTFLPHVGSQNVVYRGWMLKADEYELLYSSMLAVGITMNTNPYQYQTGHHLPGWYETFLDVTPKSYFWNPTGSLSLADFCSSLPRGAYIVKDYVKSRKNEWLTSCYAPNINELPAVATEFFEQQHVIENDLVGEVVVRAFENFDKTNGEARIWWVDNNLALISSHPDTPSLVPQIPDDFIETLKTLVEQLNCPFITTDVIPDDNGVWRVIEVGDGQVSGLPADANSLPLWSSFS